MLDPSTRPNGRLELADIHNLIEQRLPLLPPFRWRLKEVPFGLDYPYWIDDPDFDLEYHVRELALAPPPTDAKLAEQVARIFARPLDRARPLWEVYVIQGLSDEHVAVMTKIHHSVIDGMSGAEIMGVLLDLGPQGRELPDTPPAGGSPDRDPGEVEMLVRGVLGAPRYVERVARALPSTIPNIEDVAVLAQIPGATTLGRTTSRASRVLRRGDQRILERGSLTPPRTLFNGRVSPHRRFAFGQLPLADVRAVKNEHGCSVNDVVLSICAGAVRRWLIEHDDLPSVPLVAQVPVSVRTESQAGTYGNRIGMLSVPLFTNERDPVRRLMLTHDAMLIAKERHKALPAELLQDATQFIPPAVFSRASRITFSLAASRKPLWNLVVSNVPGPQFPLYMAGARLVAHYPVSVITDGMGLNMTVMSYDGHLDFGIVADREQIRDVWRLYGVSDAMLLLAGLGVDPWDVLHQGLSRRFGLGVGTWAVIVGALVLLLWIPLRQRPGFGTISNVLVIGWVIDVGLALVHAPHALAPRAALLVLGVVLNGIATGAYIGAGLGPGPRDGLMTGLAARGHSIRVVRTGIELTVLAAGAALGGTVGIGTVVYALGIGPLAHVFVPLLRIHPAVAPAPVTTA